MKSISNAAALLVLLTGANAGLANSPQEWQQSVNEIRIVCADELQRYEARPNKTGLEQNVVGIGLSPAKGWRSADAQEMARRMQWVQILNEENFDILDREMRMTSLCIESTRLFHIKGGLGNVDGAKADWKNYQSQTEQIAERFRANRRAAQPSTPIPAPAAPSANAGATGCASTPQEAFRRFGNEMEELSRSKPNAPPKSSSGSGARDQNQYALFYGTEGLTILEKYRTCLSPADYESNKRALEGARDNGRAGCERLSTSPGSCTATYPAGWSAM
jgi:hypothetical protein